MKKILAVFCLCALGIMHESCNKNVSKINNNLIAGIWELRQTSGQAGIKNYEPGNGNIFYFSSDSFKKLSSNVLTDSGTFQLVHDTSASENVCLVLNKGEYETRIKFNNVDLPKKFIQISNDSLFFLSGCFATDAGTSEVYVKQNYIY